jgi:DNA-binding transcriptional regulator LsrR (DeoR family)
VQNGLPAFNRTKPGVTPDVPPPGSKGSGIQMQLQDGRPTTIGKIYELATSINPETNQPWTRAEIADEMMISKNQVSVTYHKLRKAGYSVDVVPSVSAVGARGEKGQMMLALKRQGLSNGEIANRVNMIYGKDAVHGGKDTNAAAVGVTLSKLRSKMRGNGEVVDFGMGLALPTAAASMMLTEGESSEEQLEAILGTEEEKRAAMARAMLGGY